MVRIVVVDAPFADGTKLVTLIDPITPGINDIRPGEIIVGDDPIALFPGVPRVSLTVINRGDRDIQVRSQSHFFETNPALEFDRRAAWGHKLDIPSGATGGATIPVEFLCWIADDSALSQWQAVVTITP